MAKDKPPTRRSTSAGGAKRARPAINAHIRLSGVVRIGPRYAMLDADEDGIWRLRSDEDLARFAEQRVTTEARVVAGDELTVLWIGAEETPDRDEGDVGPAHL
jgi:hypothetical protein